MHCTPLRGVASHTPRGGALHTLEGGCVSRPSLVGCLVRHRLSALVIGGSGTPPSRVERCASCNLCAPTSHAATSGAAAAPQPCRRELRVRCGSYHRHLPHLHVVLPLDLPVDDCRLGLLEWHVATLGEGVDNCLLHLRRHVARWSAEVE